MNEVLKDWSEFLSCGSRGVKKLKLISVALHCKHISTVAVSTIIILFLFWRAAMNVSSFADTNVS